jgi:hypothetical protein
VAGHDFDAHLEVPGILSWLGVGRIPLISLLVLFLAGFGLGGFAIQHIVLVLTGAMLPASAASAAALVAALPITASGARVVRRIMPRDETTAVSLDTLVGRRARITVGRAKRGSPARAAVHDAYDQVHYVMVQPDGDETFDAGDDLLLVRREGDLFVGIGDGSARLPRLDDFGG